MRNRLTYNVLLGGTAFALTACGGGGGGGTNFIPPPPSAAPTTAPVTSSSQTIKIFTSPIPTDYSSVGVSTKDSLNSGTDRLVSTSAADADQPHIRYNSAGYYEIQLPGAQFDRLIPYKGLANPDPNSNNYFQPASVAQNLGYLVTSNSRDVGYSYSELASWGNRNLSLDHGFGVVAFGVPTPAGSVPRSGTASYAGTVHGTSDILNYDNLFQSYYATGVGGTVALDFNLGAGTLSGSIDLSVDGDMNPIKVGTFAFANTVFSVGSTTYSGRFDTQTAGANFFLGRFTGPGAEETIGAWALPFVYSGDGQSHQAIGAWIAKKP